MHKGFRFNNAKQTKKLKKIHKGEKNTIPVQKEYSNSQGSELKQKPKSSVPEP